MICVGFVSFFVGTSFGGRMDSSCDFVVHYFVRIWDSWLPVDVINEVTIKISLESEMAKLRSVHHHPTNFQSSPYMDKEQGYSYHG